MGHPEQTCGAAEGVRDFDFFERLGLGERGGLEGKIEINAYN